MYRDYRDKKWDAPNVSVAERNSLKRELGWYGELALAPAGGPDTRARQQVLAPARRTLIVVLVVVFGFLGLAGVGTLGLIVLAVAWWLGSVRGNIVAGTGRVAVWAETFGLYMLIFLALGIGFSLLKPPFHRVALSGLAALLSLAALGWPRIRGVSWSETFHAIGWSKGRGLVREVGAGVATYVMMLPLMAAGLIVTLVLAAIVRAITGGAAGGVETASHPVAPMLVEASWSVKLLILVLAAVIAPLVEETMFRGVLYRHMREATGRVGGVLSFIASAAVVSFVFAAIHPQGWLGIPPLMSIAIGINIAREWRGSLISCMVAHGINNGLVLTILLLVAS